MNLLASLFLAMTTYTTDFSAFAPEDPISEGGKWTNTVPSVWNTSVSTVAGTPARCVGLLGSSANDSVSKMTGVWGPDQTVSGTILTTGAGNVSGAELELHCRMTMISGSPDNIFTYEFDFVGSGTNRCDIVRWDGPQSTFVLLSSVTLAANLVTGDIITVSAIGPKGAVVLSVYLNGTLQGSFTDTDAVKSLATGQPGIGFDNENLLTGGDLFAYSGYTATDGVTLDARSIGSNAWHPGRSPGLGGISSARFQPSNWWPYTFTPPPAFDSALMAAMEKHGNDPLVLPPQVVASGMTPPEEMPT